MKKLIMAVVIVFITIPAISKNTEAIADKSLSKLLTIYYDIKDALVSDDGAIASTKASEFVKAINSIDIKALPAEEKKAFEKVQKDLLFDAEHISETKDIGHQRDHFSSFSDNMIKLSKSVNLSDESAYIQYCPMRKVYWLSKDQAVKNPYYGKQMLTCGKVTETVK